MTRLRDLMIVAVIVGLGVMGWRIERKVERTLDSIERTSLETEKLVTAYAQVVGSEKNQKAVEASLAAAATWQATGRLTNTVVIPEITRTVRAATRAIEDVGRLSATVSREVEVQSGETTKTQEEVRATLSGVQDSIEGIKEATEGLAKTGERVAEELGTNVTRSAGKVDEVVEQLRVSAQHFAVVTANVEQASQSMPGIAKGLEKVAGRAPTYQKIGTILAIGLGLANLVR